VEFLVSFKINSILLLTDTLSQRSSLKGRIVKKILWSYKPLRATFLFLADVTIAKNYLDSKELKALNNLVSAYFDLAELKAKSNETMTMKDHIEYLDNILCGVGREVLENAGRIFTQRAKKKQ